MHKASLICYQDDEQIPNFYWPNFIKRNRDAKWLFIYLYKTPFDHAIISLWVQILRKFQKLCFSRILGTISWRGILHVRKKKKKVQMCNIDFQGSMQLF